MQKEEQYDMKTEQEALKVATKAAEEAGKKLLKLFNSSKL